MTDTTLAPASVGGIHNAHLVGSTPFESADEAMEIALR
jgi:hypothetical protein